MRTAKQLVTAALALGAVFCSSSDEGSEPPPPPAGVQQGDDTFSNFDQGTTCTLGKNLLPATVDEAVASVKWAIAAGHSIKAVSSPASHSENALICPGDGGVQINFVKMNRVLSIDADANEITVEPGAQMGDVGDALHAEGLALRNHIPIRDLTAAGSIATGAHHTSLRFPSGVHDMVKRLKLIDGTGELRVLEGAEAKGAAAHLGLLGVIVEVTFDTEPQFKTRARVTTGDDDDFENRIIDMAKSHDYASFSWYPSRNKYVLRQHDIVPADTPGEAYNTGWVSTPQEQSLQAGLANGINRDQEGGEDAMCGIEGLRFNGAGLSHSENGKEVDGEEAVGFSHLMFSSTCEGLECPWNNDLKIFNPEIAIRVEDLPAWMADIRALMAQKTICFPINGIVIRFSKAGASYIGMNADHDVAHVEFHIARHPDEGQHEQFAGAYDEIHELTIAKYGGRPHWGKNFPVSFVSLDTSIYPQWSKFIELKARLDPDGVFENPFWERVTGARGAELSPGCAVDRRCYCETDEHCGPGRTCQPGLVFADARVCRK